MQNLYINGLNILLSNKTNFNFNNSLYLFRAFMILT